MYAAAKGAVVSVGRSTAADLAPRNIRVNVRRQERRKLPLNGEGVKAE